MGKLFKQALEILGIAMARELHASLQAQAELARQKDEISAALTAMRAERDNVARLKNQVTASLNAALLTRNRIADQLGLLREEYVRLIGENTELSRAYEEIRAERERTTGTFLEQIKEGNSEKIALAEFATGKDEARTPPSCSRSADRGGHGARPC